MRSPWIDIIISIIIELVWKCMSFGTNSKFKFWLGVNTMRVKVWTKRRGSEQEINEIIIFMWVARVCVRVITLELSQANFTRLWTEHFNSILNVKWCTMCTYRCESKLIGCAKITLWPQKRKKNWTTETKSNCTKWFITHNVPNCLHITDWKMYIWLYSNSKSNQWCVNTVDRRMIAFDLFIIIGHRCRVGESKREWDRRDLAMAYFFFPADWKYLH